MPRSAAASPRARPRRSCRATGRPRADCPGASRGPAAAAASTRPAPPGRPGAPARPFGGGRRRPRAYRRRRGCRKGPGPAAAHDTSSRTQRRCNRPSTARTRPPARRSPAPRARRPGRRPCRSMETASSLPAPLRPKPRRSGAITRYCGESAAIWPFHMPWSSGKPWTSSTTGPRPQSTYRSSTPPMVIESMPSTSSFSPPSSRPGLAEQFELSPDEARVRFQLGGLGLVGDGVFVVALGEVDAAQGIVVAAGVAVVAARGEFPATSASPSRPRPGRLRCWRPARRADCSCGGVVLFLVDLLPRRLHFVADQADGSSGGIRASGRPCGNRRSTRRCPRDSRPGPFPGAAAPWPGRPCFPSGRRRSNPSGSGVRAGWRTDWAWAIAGGAIGRGGSHGGLQHFGGGQVVALIVIHLGQAVGGHRVTARRRAGGHDVAVFPLRPGEQPPLLQAAAPRR